MPGDPDYHFSSPPCLLGESEWAYDLPFASPAITPLVNRLTRALDQALGTRSAEAGAPLTESVAQVFSAQNVASDAVLAEAGEPWSHVCFVQYGILQLCERVTDGTAIIQEFFSEGSLIWPLFPGNRTARNNWCLSAVTAGQVWIADFDAVCSILDSQGLWGDFQHSLKKEIAERTRMQDYRRHTMTPHEHYQLMLQERPEITRRVPAARLASWLGINPTVFSRFQNS